MLTPRMQVQLIADRMAGLPTRPGLKLTQFAEPWRTCWRVLDQVPDQDRACDDMLNALRAAGEDVDDIADELLAAVPGARPPGFRALCDLAASLPPVDYLWKPTVPRGMVTLVGAPPGVGKTSLVLELCRRVLAGEPFPDGTPMPEWTIGRNVIFVDGEGVPQVINERAQAWGMDTRRLYLMEPEDDEEIDFDRGAGRNLLVEMVAALDPALVAIDSLGAVTSRGENSIDDVRDIMRFFKRLARDANCGFVVNHHMRKRNQLAFSDVPTLDDFRGHGHITMVARSVIALSLVQTGPEPDPNGPRQITILKNNLAAVPKPLGFELVPQPGGGFSLKFGDAPQRYAEPLPRDDCASWLLETLEENGGKMKPGEAVALARKAGFSRTMVYGARKLLAGQIRDSQSRRSPANEWILADGSDRP